jgi:heat shock protein HslJ
MKNSIFTIFYLIFVLAAFSFACCIINSDNAASYELQNKNWYLMEVRSKTGVISIDRTDAPMDIYSIRFEAERFSGIGAPNCFFAPYTAKKDHSLFIKRIAGTRMSSLYEMDEFREYEYFAQLERVNRWETRKGNLKLYSCDEDGEQVILVFSY